MDTSLSVGQILKSLVAPARYSDGPTLYLICRTGDGPTVTIHEQLPDGECRRWPEPPSPSVQLAEGLIYLRARGQKTTV